MAPSESTTAWETFNLLTLLAYSRPDLQNGQQLLSDSAYHSATHHRIDEEKDEGRKLDVRDDFYPFRHGTRYDCCCRRCKITRRQRTKSLVLKKKNAANRNQKRCNA